MAFILLHTNRVLAPSLQRHHYGWRDDCPVRAPLSVWIPPVCVCSTRSISQGVRGDGGDVINLAADVCRLRETLQPVAMKNKHGSNENMGGALKQQGITWEAGVPSRRLRNIIMSWLLHNILMYASSQTRYLSAKLLAYALFMSFKCQNEIERLYRDQFDLLYISTQAVFGQYCLSLYLCPSRISAPLN